MRISFAGSLPILNKKVIIFTTDSTFEKAAYPGYTNYDVIAIGAGAGRGGGCSGPDSEIEGLDVRNTGGAGGAGGFHRVKGLLEILEDSVTVIVGVPGDNGVDEVSDPDDTTDGEDGGYSSFSDFCKASGGKGGHRATTCSVEANMEADGGEGGLGNRTTAGGGGDGGSCGIVDPAHFPGTDGSDGILHEGGLIGAGGGGGAGGIAIKTTELDPLFTDEGPDYYEAAFDHNSPFATPGPYQTVLTGPRETEFRSWIDLYSIPFDPDADIVDYDMRGYWRYANGTSTTPVHDIDAHFPDTWKTPYDTTFSAESKYATPDCPFKWQGDRLMDTRYGILIFGDSLTDPAWYRHLPYPTAGGRGSYDSDEIVSGLSGAPFYDPDVDRQIVPGRGGGARITPLNRSNLMYGASRKPGVVAILLTKE